MSGFEGIVAGCLVAIKQIMPDNEIMLLTGVIRFRAKVCMHVLMHGNSKRFTLESSLLLCSWFWRWCHLDCFNVH